MPSSPLRIAFIGTGNMAGLHLRALRRVRTPHTVVGVHDVSAAAAQAFAARAGARACASVPELLETRPDVVHICTPAGTHFAPARAALLAGAHVYVEKPFVETRDEAEALFAAAQERGVLICAGHQLVRDRAFLQLTRRAFGLEQVALVDSYFAFRPPRADPARASRRALARQLVDVLPHPLYTLVAALERLGPFGGAIELVRADATPTELHALLAVGPVTGRLHVSLRARPIASTLSVVGTGGTLTADFVRAIVFGAGNPGTSPFEKIVNPFLEAAQIAGRSAVSLARRLLGRSDYPGLVELIDDFYAAAARGGRSPLSVDHLRRVTAIHQDLSAQIWRAAGPVPAPRTVTGPLAVVTGAGGFFGRSICRGLARRGFRVRGLGRVEPPDDPHVHEWVRADLSEAIPPEALHGAAVIVHAAAETAGGFEAHARNTVGATRRVLDAMTAAGVRRLIHVSSLSVIRPPRFREPQDERTPLASRADRLGAYTWGKAASEELVAAASRDIQVRIVRPAALIDWADTDLPGLLGRRLFGRWYLGLGRPGLPFAVCEVEQAGAAVAWCAEHFGAAPAVVNLMDPGVLTRGRFLEVLRNHGWRGRVVWVPISVLAGVMTLLLGTLSLLRRGPRPPDAWSVLRPRRYDPSIAAGLFTTLAGEAALAVTERPSRPKERASPTYA
jgi:predicted dehydrogenase/nucleoside-diphosphate-sugar epimerase